jgi:hypothetical protein
MAAQLALDWNAIDPSGLVVAPSVYPQARETSAIAGVMAGKERSADNARLLALITAAGETGMSDQEIREATGWERQTICLRRFDLRRFLIPGSRRAKSLSGRPMCTWRRRNSDEMEATS